MLTLWPRRPRQHYPALVGRLIVDCSGKDHPLLPRAWVVFRPLLSDALLSRTTVLRAESEVMARDGARMTR